MKCFNGIVEYYINLKEWKDGSQCLFKRKLHNSRLVSEEAAMVSRRNLPTLAGREELY